ncbi:hypothetical protein B0J14DRAFT_609207 [Halenospora varia]|nr:hypothetical protein B0J14DRAFT_609207 [Halenospora varia]
MTFDPILLAGQILLASMTLTTLPVLRGRTASPATNSILQKAFAQVTAAPGSLHQPIEIAVAINKSVTVPMSKYKILTKLQGNGQDPSPKAAGILDQIWRETRSDFQLQTFNGTHVLTDNFVRYIDLANQATRIEVLEEDGKLLKLANKEWQREKRLVCGWEMKYGFDRISKIILPNYKKEPLSEEEKKIAYDRNSGAHEITLLPSLDALNSPEFEGIKGLDTCFAAFFGVSADEAKVMLKMDAEKEFMVEKILNLHAFLWKSGTCNKFVKPFDKWVVVMKEVIQKPEACGTVDVKHYLLAAAAEASSCGREDKIAARSNMAECWDNVAEGSKDGFISDKRVYFWDTVKEDWEHRGVFEAMDGMKE